MAWQAMQGKTMARACPGPLGAHPGAAAADVKQGRGLFLGVARPFALRRGNQRIGIAVTNLKFLDCKATAMSCCSCTIANAEARASSGVG
jgi:hypothetical protein